MTPVAMAPGVCRLVVEGNAGPDIQGRRDNPLARTWGACCNIGIGRSAAHCAARCATAV
jgi:hypothetical protein